jgi:hypothetical protein
MAFRNLLAYSYKEYNQYLFSYIIKCTQNDNVQRTTEITAGMVLLRRVTGVERKEVPAWQKTNE